MRFVHLGFAPRLVDYEQGWATQREVHAQVVEGALPDTTLLLEHAAVYTAGKRTEAHERPTDGTPVVDVDRGGKITWHGPGQLVGYPIVRLPEVPIDVVAHVRRLEEVMIRVCRDVGVETVACRRAQRGLGPRRRPRARPQARRHRGARQPAGDDARVRAELRRRPVVGRHDHPVRHRGCRCLVTDAGVGAAGSASQDVLPYAEKHLGDVLG